MKAGLKVSLFYGREQDVGGDAVVAIYNSVAKHLDVLKDFEMIVCDEVHHLGASEFSRILGEIHKKRYALGITSVIQRMDGNQSMILSFLPVVYEMSLSRAREMGWVADVKIVGVGVEMDGEEWAEYDMHTETIKRYFRMFPYTDVFQVQHPLAYAARAAIQKRKILLANVREKKRVIKEILKENINERVIIFNTSIESIEAIKNIVEEDEELKSRFAIYHSQMSKKEREQMLEKFRVGEKNIMLSVKCLEEGIDVPEASVGIILASDRTKRSFIQKLGRIMRKTEQKWKKMYVIYCKWTVEEEIKRRIEWLLLR
jgi:superfamily II DNA or RNA helicase